MNMKGTGNKFAFVSTELMKVIIEA